MKIDSKFELGALVEWRVDSTLSPPIWMQGTIHGIAVLANPSVIDQLHYQIVSSSGVTYSVPESKLSIVLSNRSDVGMGEQFREQVRVEMDEHLSEALLCRVSSADGKENGRHISFREIYNLLFELEWLPHGYTTQDKSGRGKVRIFEFLRKKKDK